MSCSVVVKYRTSVWGEMNPHSAILNCLDTCDVKVHILVASHYGCVRFPTGSE